MANEYFQRTPTSSGNRSTHTWSGWIKRNVLGDWTRLFSTAGQTLLQLTGSTPDQIRYLDQTGSNYDLRSSSLLRDVGSWMHIVLSVDHTLSLPRDRVRIYVNGVELHNYSTDSSSNGPQNLQTFFNTVTEHGLLGRETANTGENFKGEAFDVFWVDGQALTPDVFGFYKDGDGYISAGSTQATDFRPGQWSPRAPKSIKYTINRSGGFGVNGFYLPMNDSSNTGADFHCDPNSIIKLKGEDLPQPRNGAPTTSDAYVSQLRSDPFAANLILACPFVADGFGQDGAVSSTIPGLGDYHIALGGPSSIPAVNFLIGSGNQAKITGDKGLYYGSSLDVSNNSINPRATVGTAFTPDGDYTVEFWAYQNDLTDVGGAHILQYDSDAGQTGWLISSDVGTFRWMLRNSSNQDVQVSTPNVVKSGQWNHFAGVYESSKNTMTAYLNGVAVGTTAVASNYLSTQYTNLNRIHIGSNGGGGSRPMLGYMSDLRIYKGVAKYTGGFDVPKPYTPVGIEPFRTTADTCKNNFATLNPIFGIGRQDQLAYANGNLTVTSSATSGSDTTAVSTTAIKGKIYCEFYLPSDAIGVYVGAAKSNTPFADGIDTTASSDCWLVRGDTGNKANGESGSGLSYGGSFANGDIIMMAVDIDNSSIWWGRNGSWNASGNPATNSNAAYTNLPSTEDLLTICGDNYSDKVPSIHVNFGQNQTFANLKAVNNNRINNGTGDSVWHQSSNTGNHNDWTVSSGGTKLDVAVSGGNYARAKLRAVDGTIDPKKTYLLSFKYVTGPSNLGVQNEHGYMTAVDGSASPSGLSSGNYYSFIIQGTREFNFTGFTGSTYSLDEVVVSEIDECYTDASGKGKFHYQPPTGFLALCEDNLPTPAIADPGEHFKAVLYKNSQKVSGVGFKPDLIWTKSRNQLYSHYLYDSVRGVGGIGLNSDNADPEGTSDAGGILSFDDDGFTWSTDAGLSQTEAVAWCWKAGGAAVSNTDGSITSQVSANQTAGFSIVSYTGNNTDGASIGHGLGKKPSLIIVKERNGSSGWFVFQKDIGPTGFLQLHDSPSVTTDAGAGSPWFGTEPTDQVFTVGANGATNDNTRPIIAYCWSEIENYSRIGKYSGNDSANGSVIYCGFKPALVITKRFDAGGSSNWLIHDSSRDPVNPVMGTIWGNLNNIEGRSNVIIDMLSNGFKHRNGDGGTGNNRGLPAEYIFIAFAESPFQTANAK
jgi:hypothetical protein